jgi:hypothetical protein
VRGAARDGGRRRRLRDVEQHRQTVGEHISRKLESAEWGDAVVDQLAAAIARRHPGLRGFTRRNLFRMRQFYETYRRQKKVSALLTQLPWTHHLVVMGQANTAAER